MTINFISAAVIVTLLVLVSFLVIRSISVSLAKILCHTSSSEVIDLTRKIDITSKDEFGQIASWMNDFVENLNGIISNVSGAAKKVQEVSSDAAATNKTVSAGTAEQMNEAMTMAAAIEELSSSITDVARNSSAVAESASSTYSLAKNSGVVINRTMEEMHQVAQFVDEAVAIISKLGESSQEIDEITSVINDIADQTNLLALNAAIEAARAGEQGRGFAVVADEVRALAERTSQATRKITAMVQIIQGDTGKIISCIQSGKKQVTQGVEMANEAQKELEKILISIDDVTVKTQQIATAAEEQSSTSSEISANIERIVAISRDTSRLTADATTRTAELGITVADLSRVVCKFKTA
jgi:methyl-accepting chemotaxis protein